MKNHSYFSSENGNFQGWKFREVWAFWGDIIWCQLPTLKGVGAGTIFFNFDFPFQNMSLVRPLEAEKIAFFRRFFGKTLRKIFIKIWNFQIFFYFCLIGEIFNVRYGPDMRLEDRGYPENFLWK